MDFDDWANDLATEELPDAKPAKTDAPRHPCTHCGGTGEYLGVRVHQEKQHCFNCRGKGWFTTSASERAKASASRKASKARKQAAVVEKFAKVHPEVVAALDELRTWNNIAMSMHESLSKYGSLTQKQIDLILSLKARSDERTAARAAEKVAQQAAAVAVDLSRVHELFTVAKQNKIGRPVLRLDGFVLSMAPASGVNAGAIYVKSATGFDSDYYGKVIGGKFVATRSAPQRITDALLALAADPLTSAVAYGRKTGRCSCCGRELTNATSIEAGIGPICLEKWGI